MTDKTFGQLTRIGSLTGDELGCVENGDGNSRAITKARERNFMAGPVTAALNAHIADMEAHGISEYFGTLVGADDVAALRTLLGVNLTKADWVSDSITEGDSVTVTFATPFPTACDGVNVQGINTSAVTAKDCELQLVSKTASGFVFYVQAASPDIPDNTLDGYSYVAIGK